MKKLLLPLLLMAQLSPLFSAQDSGDVPGTPLGYDSADQLFGYSRFWSYYNPYPSNFIGSSEWFDGNALTGDWWGIRNMLDDSGVELSASYTNNIAGNPVGGMTQSFDFVGTGSISVSPVTVTLINAHVAAY